MLCWSLQALRRKSKKFGNKKAVNVLNATMEGLSQLMDAETVAKLRSKAVEEILE